MTLTAFFNLRVADIRSHLLQSRPYPKPPIVIETRRVTARVFRDRRLAQHRQILRSNRRGED